MDELIQRLPSWAQVLLHFLLDERVLWGLGVGSAVLFVLSVVGVPWFLARVPADFFSPRERRRRELQRKRPTWWVALKIAKNFVGLLLLILGIAMLFLPGQGVLTILVASTLLDFPGKYSLQRRVLRRPGVLSLVNRLRRRSGKEPLNTEGW